MQGLTRGLSRRDLVAGSLMAGGGPAMAAARVHSPGIFQPEQLGADVERYFSFGVKASGGPGDGAAAAWLGDALAALGYELDRQVFDVPWFEAAHSELTFDGESIQVHPQPPAAQTVPSGLEGPLDIRAPWSGSARCDGAIALVVLPFRRWSALAGPEAQGAVDAAFAAGAAAVLLVTTGPTGEAIALNASSAAPPFPGPVAVLAPREAGPALTAASRGERGRLTIVGHGGRRPAANLIARRVRPGRPRLVLSSPRSGWFACAGERGPGVATWLALARWAPDALPDIDVTLLSTSGHEYENLGGELFLRHLAPSPEETALWVHLGANLAARDWNDLGTLTPLPSADPQRVLMVTEPLAAAARRVFAGQPGLEMVRAASAKTAAGELGNILSAGYREVCGVFGAHRFHHTAVDDLRCVDPHLTARAAVGFRDLIAARFRV